MLKISICGTNNAKRKQAFEKCADLKKKIYHFYFDILVWSNTKH